MEVTGANRYNPELLPELEKNVEAQVAQKTYNLDSNLCLLRLYQFYPERVNPRVLSQLLLKSLMALPNPDFETSMRMINERLQVEEPIASLSVLAGLLQSSQFGNFWNLYGQMQDAIDSAVPSFKEAARGYVIHTLTTNFQKCPKAIVSESIGLDGAALDAFIKARGWPVSEGTTGPVVQFPENECNAPVSKKTTEHINFNQVTACMTVGQPPANVPVA